MLSNAKLAAILDEVRNRLLRWSMELDKAGIKGDGLRFTQQEKNVAHNIVVQGVMNVGVVGDVHSATNIAVGDHARANNIDFKDIQQLLAAIEPHVSTGFVPAADKDELLSLLAELKKGSAEGHVKTSNVERILRQVLRVVGKLGDHVLSAGIKVVVEAWMRGHGMVQ